MIVAHVDDGFNAMLNPFSQPINARLHQRGNFRQGKRGG
jgi:hypothetical protein